MRIISKWFWRLLQHISAPSEKEIRESLIRFMVIICCAVNTAPVLAYPFPTPTEFKERTKSEIARQREDLIENDKIDFLIRVQGNLKLLLDERIESRFEFDKGDYSPESISRARKVLQSQGWALIITEDLETHRFKVLVYELAPSP